MRICTQVFDAQKLKEFTVEKSKNFTISATHFILYLLYGLPSTSRSLHLSRELFKINFPIFLFVGHLPS
jgi:hypothetical protein